MSHNMMPQRTTWQFIHCNTSYVKDNTKPLIRQSRCIQINCSSFPSCTNNLLQIPTNAISHNALFHCKLTWSLSCKALIPYNVYFIMFLINTLLFCKMLSPLPNPYLPNVPWLPSGRRQEVASAASSIYWDIVISPCSSNTSHWNEHITNSLEKCILMSLWHI